MKELYFQFKKNRPIDLICMGRVAIDLYAEQIGSDLAEAKTFKKYLGGCAGNICLGCARLGLNTMMFSCVGKDDLGKFIKETLAKEKVGLDLLYESDKHLTGLVLLGIKPPDNFPLIFYRNDCADMQLKPELLSSEILAKAKALLITGTGLSTSSMFNTTLHLVKLAQKLGTKIILDLDYRPVLWQLTSLGDGETRYLSSAKVSQTYQQILPYCDLIVGTEEELCIAGGFEDKTQALSSLRSLSKAPIVIKTGAKGSEIYFPKSNEPFFSKPFPVEILNVLGAGDGFMAGLLRGLLKGCDWQQSTTYANASGALVVTRHGCSSAIPYWDELNYFIESFEKDPRVWQSAQLAKLHQQEELSAPRLHIKNPKGFKDGLNPIVTCSDASLMKFYSLKLRQGQDYYFSKDYEFAALLMTGRVIFNYEKHSVQAERCDYFSENPQVLHCPAGTNASLIALTDCEILLVETANDQRFSPEFFNEINMIEIDRRGKDLLEDSSYRIVRTIFDKRNRPNSNLILGEIISFQGRWSSYPSHYHEQPEIYHYRFSEPQGYAFGENGDEVLRIQHNDTYQILKGQTHAHCTAPGYLLYTLWCIRHLEANPYLQPSFLAQHEWTRKPSANRRVLKIRNYCGEF